jgi:hypothetical protein
LPATAKLLLHKNTVVQELQHKILNITQVEDQQNQQSITKLKNEVEEIKAQYGQLSAAEGDVPTKNLRHFCASPHEEEKAFQMRMLELDRREQDLIQQKTRFQQQYSQWKVKANANTALVAQTTKLCL